MVLISMISIPSGSQNACIACEGLGRIYEKGAAFHELAISPGRTPTIEDLMTAAIAQTNNLTVATHNVGDFEYLGVPVFNPYEA